MTKESVLIIGGSGLVGSRTAKTLRQLYPDLPITIGGRDLAKARAVARELGAAEAVAVELGRRDLGRPGAERYSAVVIFVKDVSSSALLFAQDRGAAYVEISTAAFELAPDVAHFMRRPHASPVMFAGTWLAGAATMPALLYARRFRAIERIDIAAVLDELDIGGPAAGADFERHAEAGAGALVFEQGSWRWLRGDGAARSFRDVGGAVRVGHAYAILDPLSLVGATDARSVRFDLVVGESSSRRRGEPFSSETIIEIAGELESGARGRTRHELVHPEGQAPVTAVGVATAVEHLLGLHGKPAAQPGLYFPELLIEPETLLRRLEQFGLSIQERSEALE
ncbi:NAD(P)-dependent oxidoreductase [Sorangium sp. So ce1078]|uniref:NAD(P)-dependent oxidoreductase n=1 Tax=Sorangium sp. So ce1078 TaxID=3133329 RepID=UPI003F632611